MAAALAPARMAAAAAPRDPGLEVLDQRPPTLGLEALQVGCLAENPAGQSEAREAQARQENPRRAQPLKKGWPETLRYREGRALTCYCSKSFSWVSLRPQPSMAVFLSLIPRQNA